MHFAEKEKQSHIAAQKTNKGVSQPPRGIEGAVRSMR